MALNPALIPSFANKQAIYDYVGGQRGNYSADQANAIAQLLGERGGYNYGLSFQELQSLANENAAQPGYSISSSGGGGGGGLSAADQAAYDQSINNINSAIGRLGNQLNSGYSEIDASYNNALNQLLLGKNQAKTAYDNTKHTTALDYVGGKNTIGSNAGSTLNSLARLLGARGAGGSSAATVTAPQAVARQATLQRNSLGNTFGANNQALDTNWNNYLTGYENQVSGAGSQRQQQRGALERSIESNRATLLQQLASLTAARSGAAAAQPFIDQANAALDRTANYTVSPITYKVDAYQAPSLDKYIVNPNAAPTVEGQGASNDYFSPYLAALLGKKQVPGVVA